MRSVIFDSSFLMAVSETPTDWEDELVSAMGGYSPVILNAVEAELRRISKTKGKKAKQASVALQIAKDFAKRSNGKGDVDDELVSAALTLAAPVATVDGGLLKALRASGARVVTLRRGRVWTG